MFCNITKRINCRKPPICLHHLNNGQNGSIVLHLLFAYRVPYHLNGMNQVLIILHFSPSLADILWWGCFCSLAKGCNLQISGLFRVIRSTFHSTKGFEVLEIFSGKWNTIFENLRKRGQLHDGYPNFQKFLTKKFHSI